MVCVLRMLCSLAPSMAGPRISRQVGRLQVPGEGFPGLVIEDGKFLLSLLLNHTEPKLTVRAVSGGDRTGDVDWEVK